MSIMIPSNVPFNHIKTNYKLQVTNRKSNVYEKTSSKIISNYKINSIFNSQDNYSNNSFNSETNIFINTIASDITNILKDKLNSIEYHFFVNYIVDKKLDSVINRDGTFKYLNGHNDYINRINKKLEGINKNKIKVNFDHKLMQSKFKEVVNKTSGLDALVLENEDEFWIICACCNDNSKEDVMAISYALLYQITGSDELWSSLANLLSHDKEKIIGFDIKDIVDGKNYYIKQRTDNIELIKKYNNKGKKVYLAGFSLGGGIMLDSYARLKYANYIQYEDVYLTVFNPFMTYLEIDDQKQKKKYVNNSESLISVFKKTDKQALIYSIEGDTVTQFSKLSKELDSQIVYIKGKETIDYDLDDINDAFYMITGENSRHGFKGIDLSCFSKNGCLLKTGEAISANEVVGGDRSTNNLGTIIQTIIDQHLQEQVGDYIKNLPSDQKWMESELYNLYFDFRHYLINNAGHYDSESLIDSIINPLTRLMKEGALRENGQAFISNLFINNVIIKNSLKEYIRTDNGSNTIKNILDSFLSGNIDKVVDKLQLLLTNIYYNTEFMKYITELQTNYQRGYDIGSSLKTKIKKRDMSFKDIDNNKIL